MQIKRPRDLELRDLLRIESPTFAPSNLPLDTGIASPSLHRALDLADDFIGSPYRSDSERMDRLKGKLRDGSLVLVKGTTDTPPFSPLIAWEEDGVLPGRWKVVKDVHGLNLASWVARMNDWQITPEQVERLGPGSVGHLSADSFDSDLREQRAAERERVQRDSQKNLSLPVGAAAGVAPLVAQASSTSKEESVEKKLHIEVGIFTDGTLNNSNNIELFHEQVQETCLSPHRKGEISDEECQHRLALMMGTSYANGETNVSKLFRLYNESREDSETVSLQRFRVYSPGVGTETGEADSLSSSVSGLGDFGIINQLRDAFDEVADLISGPAGSKTVSRLTIDIFGFSRGAAAARHAASEISKGSTGMLGAAFKTHKVDWPQQVRIRFVGLFDTVAGIVNISNGDWSPGDERTAPINVYLDHNKVEKAVQFFAADECRSAFSLVSLRSPSGQLPDNFVEVGLPGAHSDVGGGYHKYEIETVQLARTRTISDHRAEWPQQTMEWDNLVALKEATFNQHWMGGQSLEDASAGTPYLDIRQSKRADPPPYGQVDLTLEMKRALRGEYAHIPLNLMHSEAIKDGVPFREVELLKDDGSVPDELSSIHEKMSDALESGSLDLALSEADEVFLKQRYIHHSDNFNTMEFMVGGMPSKLEIPWDLAMPSVPATDRHRTVHPNKQEQK
ncbi:DUF2235 domain-containing protein [Marinobacter sp. NFXS9]|uniref:T6SS phospholipase effector Tle1-like catalytic domain-containing protein n=1 Tax=Marinobacter sp. NFXS9 TaxID=2818433 RepID=UPI0032DFDD86